MSRKGPSSSVVLITGATGGLGQGLVEEFLAQGWHVAAGQRGRSVHFESESLFPVTLDVTQRDLVTRSVERILQRWGRIDALINCAGTTADSLAWRIRDEDWDQVLETNLRGTVLCAQAVLRTMLRQRDGHILNIASFSGRCGARGQASYAAAKAGVLGLTQSLAREVGSRNIRVNALLPGVLPTPMTAHLSPRQLAEFSALNVLGRINSVEEVARFVAFLVTTKNISGQMLQLDSRIAPWT